MPSPNDIAHLVEQFRIARRDGSRYNYGHVRQLEVFCRKDKRIRPNYSAFYPKLPNYSAHSSLDHAVNWEAISAIGQIVGAIGVVVSLIYVATEVRSSARATQLASRRSISEIFTQLSRQLAEHPDLRELYYRGLHDFESLEGTDLVGFAQVMLQLFRAYEEAYYGHLEGDVDPRLWRGWEAAMRDINGYPGVQAYWRSRSHWYSEEFAKYINQLQQTAKPPRLYREPIGDE
jgi:hypothetical protein